MEKIHALTTGGFALVFCVTVCFTSMKLSNHYIRRYEMDNKVYNDGILEEMHARDKMMCVCTCNKMEGCCVAQFHIAYRRCRLYDHNNRMNTTTDRNGWKSWSRIEKKFGEPCTDSCQCNYKHGHCLRGECSCVIGYSYDFDKHVCVTACSSYGSAFSMYKDSGLKGCNTKTVTDASTRKECMEKCRDEKGFVCINCEFVFKVAVNICYMCNNTWSNQREEQKSIGGSHGWIFYYRHCK